MIPTDTIEIITTEWHALSALGAQLTEEQWKAPTELPGWSSQDVIAHLIGTERMLQGHAVPPRGDSDFGEHVRNPIGEFNEIDVVLRRDLPGATVLAEWDALAAERETTLRAGDDAYYDQPMSTPTGPGTMADFLHIRILDCFVHEQDIRRAVRIPGNLDSPAAAHTIDRLIRTIPIVVGKRAACPEGAAVVVEITGGVQRIVRCEVTNGRAAIVAETTAPPIAVVTLDTEAFLALATGRLTAADVAGRIALDGDVDLGQRVVGNLNMMI